MAEESNELKQNSGVLSETDRTIISTDETVDNDAFVEKYTDKTSASETDEDVSAETEEIRDQIEETRSQMSETIDAIQEKLSFSNISEQVKEQVSEQINSAFETAKGSIYDATIGKAGDFMKKVNRELSKTNIGETARDSPLPLLLIGLGIGLLAYKGFGGKKHRPVRSFRYDSDYEGRETYDANLKSGKSTLNAAQDKIGGAASSAYNSVSGAANSAVSSVGDAANSAYTGVTSATSSAYDSVSNAASQAYDKAGDLGSQARDQYDYYIEENPLAIGAVALAVGAAVGFAIPATRYESQLMGETRDSLMSKAQDAAGGLVDKVKQVANEAQKTIGDEVKTAVEEVKTQASAR